MNPAVPIPFISQLDQDEERTWIEALAAAMPNEKIAGLGGLGDADLASTDLAIVANPRPADIRRLPRLVWVHSVWAGVEKLLAGSDGADFEIVRLVDPELSRTMAEAVLAWTLYLHRDMPAYARQQKQRIWRQRPYSMPGQRTVGFVGFGELARASAELLTAHGFPVMAWSRSKKLTRSVETFEGGDSLSAMLPKADIAICLVPLTEDTRGLIDSSFIAKMRKGASLINFARGPVVVTEDLLAALDGEHLTHAVLDVFDEEPLPAESPLWTHPGITVLPHISAATNPVTAAKIVAQNIERYRKTGQLPPVVDRTRGY